MYVSKLSEDTTYDLTGTFTPEDLKINGLSVNGTEPNDGWVSIEKGTVLDYSLKFGEYIVNYDDTTNQPVVIKGGELKSQSPSPSVLEDRTYVSGEAIENYGGYNWHVIGDDGENVTLLMDYGENGNLKLPEDPNGNLNNGQMAHCPNGEDTICSYPNTQAGYNYVLNSWSVSAIQVYLNNTFYEDLEQKIQNEIVPANVCENGYRYGGYLESEINSVGVDAVNTSCDVYNDYNVRLITLSEYYNLSPAITYSLPYTIYSMAVRTIPKIDSITKVTDTSWLYSDSIGNWLTMSKTFMGPEANSIPELEVSESGSAYISDSVWGNGYSTIRPVITVKK